MEKVVLGPHMCMHRDIAQEAMKSTSAGDVETGGHYSLANRYLIGHDAEIHGKWPMAACYF